MPIVAYQCHPMPQNLSASNMYAQGFSELASSSVSSEYTSSQSSSAPTEAANTLRSTSTAASSTTTTLKDDRFLNSVVDSISGESVVVSEDGSVINIGDQDMMQEGSNYLDDEDMKKTKKFLGKLINEIDENSRHHQIKLNQLSSMTFEDSIGDAVSVVHEKINQTDYGLAVEMEKKLSVLDVHMEALEDTAKLAGEMDQIEHFLDVSTWTMWHEIDTIDRIKWNLEKERVLRSRIADLEDRSIQYRSTLKAIQFDSGKIPQVEKHASNVYGLAEHALSVPLALVSLTTFEKILAKTRRFYENCVGLPVIDFDKIEAAIDKTKGELSIGCHNLSADQIACLSPLPTSTYSSYSLSQMSTDGFSAKSLISSSNALERAISRSRSEMSGCDFAMPLATGAHRCSSSATITMSNASVRTQSTQSYYSEPAMPRAALSCPNVDIDSVIRTALQYSSSVENIVTAESPGPNTSSSTILI